MNVNQEEEEEIATDSMYNINDLDPLVDPLALDDELADRTMENSVGSAYTSTNTTISELDSSDDGQIILVDVNSLKNAFSIPVSYGGSSSSSSIEIASKTSNVLNRSSRSEHCGNKTNSNTNIEFDPIALSLDDEITEEVEGARSDGSDSGLGLEICANLLVDKANASPNGNFPIKSTSINEISSLFSIKFSFFHFSFNTSNAK